MRVESPCPLGCPPAEAAEPTAAYGQRHRVDGSERCEGAVLSQQMARRDGSQPPTWPSPAGRSTERALTSPEGAVLLQKIEVLAEAERNLDEARASLGDEILDLSLSGVSAKSMCSVDRRLGYRMLNHWRSLAAKRRGSKSPGQGGSWQHMKCR